MSSFAERPRRRALGLVALMLGPGVLAAQTTSRRAVVVVPEALAATVAGNVARSWRVDSASVRLEWGVIPSAATFSSESRVRLTGKGDNGWLLAIFESPSHSPVAVRVRAGVADSVPVAAHGLPTDAVLAASDIQMVAKVRWGPIPVTSQPSAGWTTRRPIVAGDELTASSVTPPQIVRAGEPVRLAWRRGSVLVALEGTALNSAGLGESVSVRLAGRGGQRSGRATGPGEVQLDS